MEKHTLSRRGFLGLALAGGAAVTVGAGLLPETDLPDTEEETVPAQYALIIDTSKCTGCGACIEACHLRNDLPEGQSYIHGLVEENNSTQYLMIQCQHCADPPCATVCPTNATYIRDDGVVLINEKLCVGCKYCIVACPYDARIFNEEKGVAEKCWLCLDWVLAGGVPACVQACIPGARIFGRTDDPNSQVSQLIASGRAKPLHPEFGTRPAVLSYLIEE